MFMAIVYFMSFILSMTSFSSAIHVRNSDEYSLSTDQEWWISLVIAQGILYWLMSAVLFMMFFINRHAADSSRTWGLTVAMYVAFVLVFVAHGFGFRLFESRIPMVDAEMLLLVFGVLLLYAHHKPEHALP
eukprot:TRINITY_DN3842_c0_g1_i3.p1 TRINITY_DN3842_c0_g1~~TRINITY_DN3842_c0_g1_i3.p1  ORF type:complete len:131 (+),score=35.90 TRINITY_DN3842_c0_g1_i3:193-585(+)